MNSNDIICLKCPQCGTVYRIPSTNIFTDFHGNKYFVCKKPLTKSFGKLYSCDSYIPVKNTNNK